MTTAKSDARRTSRGGKISAAEFKARCLRLMDEVSERGRSFTITKRGKPVARLVPVTEKGSGFVGSLKGSVIFAEALTEPTGEEWDAEQM
jgi:prevent-host-death family protein